MDIAELKAAITAADARNQFDVRTIAAPEHQGSEKTVLEPAADDSGRWVVYYSEHGQMNDLVYFDTEYAACDFVYARLTEPPPPKGPPMTPEDYARAAVFKHEAEERGRKMLIDAGYDPDTLKPFPL